MISIKYPELIEKLRVGWESGKPTVVLPVTEKWSEIGDWDLYELSKFVRKEFGYATAVLAEGDVFDVPRFIFHKPDLTHERHRNAQRLGGSVVSEPEEVVLRIVKGKSSMNQ